MAANMAQQLPHATQAMAERFMRGLYRRVREMVAEEMTRRYGHVISESGGVVIGGFPVDSTPPTTGQVLTFDGTKWTPT